MAVLAQQTGAPVSVVQCKHSVAPINAAFERDWPEALRMNLLDDSLSAACSEIKPPA